MAEHTSVSELEEEAKKIKRSLEGWREIILPLSSILLWEISSSIGIIIGVTTSIFFYLWIHDPSLLTIISVLGLVITGIDYLYPVITLYFCHPERWTSAQERKLESICRSLAANKIYLINCLASFYQLKRDKPSNYYCIVLSSLLGLSFIGHLVNNLFLTYMTVTGLLLLPGVQHQGILGKCMIDIKSIRNKETMKFF